LWVMRYEQARRLGVNVRRALLHTARHVAIGNLTAATTLALAFFAAILADFKAVAGLGWIAGCGVLLCALACFTVLPSLLMIFDRRPSSAAGGRKSQANERILPDLSPGLAILSLRSSVIDPRSSEVDSWLPFLTKRPHWIIGPALA